MSPTLAAAPEVTLPPPAVKRVRMGYLVPEFPAQPHTWIWREYHALTESGLDTEFVSTRLPDANQLCHAWSQAARERTMYLMPMPVGEVLSALGMWLAAGPRVWLSLLTTVLRAEQVTLKERITLLALALPAAKLAALAKQRQWRHLHVLNPGNSANLALLCSLLTGLPYSINLVGPLEHFGGNQTQKWGRSEFGLVMSQRLRRALRDQLGPAAPEEISVAPLGVDLARAKRKAPYEPWRGEGPFTIYTCGRLNPVKGHVYLIEAVAQLRHQGLDVQLFIAGEDEQAGAGYRLVTEAAIREHGLTAAVKLLGATPEDEHLAWLERAQLFVLPSLDEGIAVSAMDAMALELPVIVTDCAAMNELVDPEIDALMVNPGSATELAAAIARLAQDPELCQQLSRHSRPKIAARFHSGVSAGAIAGQLLS